MLRCAPECYFKNMAAEYIFYLVELDGGERLDKLGVEKACFLNKEFANKRYSELLEIILEDRSHPGFCDALENLNYLFDKRIY